MLDDRLAEIDRGEFEATEENADSLELFRQALMTGNMGTESFKEFTERTYDFCDMITKDHKEQNVLIVTHSANARVINHYFNGKPKHCDFSKCVIHNAGLLTFENSKI